MKIVKIVLAVCAMTWMVSSQAIAASMGPAVICSGAARLDNGSVVALGQPLVGYFGGARAGISGSAGILIRPRAEALLPPPPQFNPLAVAPNGAARLAFGAETGWTYEIEASTNLLNWLPLWSARPEGGMVVYEDLDAVKFGLRFYRINVR